MSQGVEDSRTTNTSISTDPWTIGRILSWSKQFLAEKGSESPRLDAELLLAKVMGLERIYLYTRFDQPLSADERAQVRSLLKRRASGEPVAYILGCKEFYGRRFEVAPSVLIPRPETEELVERAVVWCKNQVGKALRILDVGTGSGCIAVSLAIEVPDAIVDAWDISADALTLAQRNAEKHGVADRINFMHQSASDPRAWQEVEYDLVVSNPPYIDETQRTQLAKTVVGYEPHQALFAEEHGLYFYRLFAERLTKIIGTPGYFVAEIGATQGSAVRSLFEACHHQVTISKDLAGMDRFVEFASTPPS